MDTQIATAQLTSKQEAFAALVAQGSALNDAYRQAYDCAEDAGRRGVNVHASKLASLPAVKARIGELRAAIAERVVIGAAELRMRQLDIATAAPLVHVKRYACRYCPTDGRRYCWIDSDEFCDALEAWRAAPHGKRQPVLTPHTYDPFAPPSPTCKRCRGIGEAFLYTPVDTTQLEGAQAAAYAGASIDARTGTIEIHQHDQQSAAQELHRMVPGALAPKQSESKGIVEHNHRVLPAELTAEEALRLYRQQQASVVAVQPALKQATQS